MMRQLFHIISLALVMASLARGAQPQPNVLVLYSDDQRADTLACLGNPHISTPALDRLARDGTVFTRAYCMGAQQGAVCIPSRAMLLTGRTLFRVKENLRGQTTWPEMFAQAGYSTFITGKWHNGRESLLHTFPNGKAIFLGGMGDPYNLPIQDISPAHNLVNGRRSGEHSVKVFADTAIEFLSRQRPGKPFLCYVAFNGPHDPRVAPRQYRDKYKDHEPPAPPNFLPEHPFNNGELVNRDEMLAPWPRTPEIVRKHLADYYAYIEFLDSQVGRIIDAVRASGQLENTIIVFASDHGLAIGSHGLFGKQNLYDHSMHAPLIIAGPGIPKGKRSDALCYLLDVFPTLGEMARVSAPAGSEGRGLLPVLTGRTETHRTAIFTAYANCQRAVRDDRWKLIVYPKINKSQLFDLHDDPVEMHDLSSDKRYSSQLARLTQLLRELQTEAGDSLSLTSANPLPAAFDFTKLKSKK